METGPDQRPSRDEAERTLDQLAKDESAVRYPPLPRWYFPVMAALVAGLALARLLGPSGAFTVTLLIGVIAALVAGKYWLNRDGVSGTSMKVTDMVPFLLGILGVFVGAWVVSEAAGASWVWILAAAMAGAIVLKTGHSYNREYSE